MTTIEASPENTKQYKVQLKLWDYFDDYLANKRCFIQNYNGFDFKQLKDNFLDNDYVVVQRKVENFKGEINLNFCDVIRVLSDKPFEIFDDAHGTILHIEKVSPYLSRFRNISGMSFYPFKVENFTGFIEYYFVCQDHHKIDDLICEDSRVKKLFEEIDETSKNK